MRVIAIAIVVVAVLAVGPASVGAHCDAVDGPVATAAVKALDTRNVNLVRPYVPGTAEAEVGAAFEQALVVRDKGPEARALADRYFMETAVRVHRAGEGAVFTGLKPAGTDLGPAIPAAERALASGRLEPLVELLSGELAHGLGERFERAVSAAGATKEPATRAAVAAARERVKAELAFIGAAQAIHQATKDGGHTE